MALYLRKLYRLFALVLTFLVALAAQADKSRFTLVIDAGHGGHDAGAVGSFSKEKTINLNVALAFGHLVESNCPDVKVIYTRKTDVFIPLQKRADIANSNKADLFISVHTNALPNGRIAYGSETYSLGMARASANLEVAKRENSVIMLENDYKRTYEGFDPNKAESYVIFEIMQDRYMKQSVELARAIQLQYGKAGRQDKGVHQAGFLVLRNTSMPAVLTELGFISTPAEEQYLNSQKGVEELSRSIYNGFLNYRRKHDKSAHDLPADLPATVSTEQQPALAANPTAAGASQVEVVPVQVTPTAQLLARNGNDRKSQTAADSSQSDTTARTKASSAPSVKPAAASKSKASAPKQEPAKQKNEAKKQPASADTKKKTSAAESKTKVAESKQQTSAKTKAADKTKTPEAKTKTDNTKDKSASAKDKSATTKDKTTSAKEKTAAGKDKTSDKTSSKTTKSKVTYRIQVGAGKKEIDAKDPQFKGLSVTRVKEGTMFKYFYGTYTTHDAAKKALTSIKAKLPAAYIVAYVNGKAASVAEARAAETGK